MSNELFLIKQLQSGSTTALSTLYDKYSGALYGVILRICKNEVLAQDLLQETFVKIWQKSHTYSPDKGTFYTWTYRIARNCTLNELRKSSELIQKEDLSVYTNKPTEEEMPLDIAKLNGSISKLELHHQKALELVYFQGFTHREAHLEMEVPLGTFKSYIQQALKQLRSSYKTIVVVIGSIIESTL